MNKPSIVKLSSLKVGTQFFFADPSLQDGVNKLTCFKKTAKGYTNGVTGRNTRSDRDADVVEAHSFTAWKHDKASQALAAFRKLEPAQKILRAGQEIIAGEWRAYGVSNSRNPVDYIHLTNSAGDHFSIYHTQFNACA